MNDVIVQFAVLWGQTIGSALSVKEIMLANEMKEYDSEELTQLLSVWATEYRNSDEEDTVEFFQQKLDSLAASFCTKETDNSSTQVIIYTDGSCLKNPGPGGYGVVILGKDGQKAETSFAAGFYHTTNNRMELMAAIKALESLTEPQNVLLISDSQYLVNAFENDWITGWKMRDWMNVKNPDLWKRLLKAMENHTVTFQWTKGHAGTKWNEHCDTLATTAAKHPKQEDLLAKAN